MYRIATGEVMEELHRILAAAAGQEGIAEVVAVLALQAALLLEPFDAVSIEHLAPDVAVVAGRVTAGKSMGEIGGAIARRHRREIDAGFFQRARFEGQNVVRHFGRRQLVPGLVEQRGCEIFGRLEALVEFFRREDFVEQLLRHRRARLVMLRVMLQHFRPDHPHLIHLGRILDEIARHARPAEARVFHVGKHPVKRMAELVEHRAHFVVGEQGRLAGLWFRNVEMIRHHRLHA